MEQEAGCEGSQHKRPPNPVEDGLLDALQASHYMLLDNIAKMVATVFQVPAAFIFVSDDPDVLFLGESPKSKLAAQLRPLQAQLVRCVLGLASEQVVVGNTSRHELLRHAAFVAGPPGIRFLACSPLLGSSGSGGRTLGTLCLLDTHARSLDARHASMLASFASMAAQEVERSQMATAAARAADAALVAAAEDESLLLSAVRLASSSDEGVLVVDVRHPEWPIVYANPSWAADTGLAMPLDSSPSFWKMLRPWTGQAAVSEEAHSSEHSGSDSDGGHGMEEAFQLATRDAVAANEAICLRVAGPRKKRALRVALRPAGARGACLGCISCDAIPESPTSCHDPPLSPAVLSADTDALGEGLEACTGRCQAVPAFWFVVADNSAAHHRHGTGSKPSSAPSSHPLWSGGASFAALHHSGPLDGSGTLLRRTGSGGSLTSMGTGVVSLPAGKLEQLQASGTVTPETFQEVELGPVIGEGAFGRVHRAEWKGVLVAVKVMETKDDVVCCDGGVRGALLEAIVGRDLSHPNIVQTYDYAMKSEAKADGSGTTHLVWIVQQYCNRGTLRDCIANSWMRHFREPDGAPDTVAILQTAQEVASAMAYLHSHGIIHGDLSSGNVLLNSSTRDHRRFTALVSDFGLASFADGGGPPTHGTVQYMPPELLDRGTVCEATDVYSFGVLLWEMWTGKKAWAGCSHAQIMLMVSSGRARLEPTADMTPSYQALCQRCLSFDHTERPTFDEVLRDLKGILVEEQSRAASSGCSEPFRPSLDISLLSRAARPKAPTSFSAPAASASRVSFSMAAHRTQQSSFSPFVSSFFASAAPPTS